MHTGCMFFMLGLLLLSYLPVLPSLYLLWLFPIALVAALKSPKYRALFWLCGGLFWGLLRAYSLLDAQLPSDFEGKSLVVEGRVVSLPIPLEGGQRFIFSTESVRKGRGEAEPLALKLRLNWFGSHEELLPGERWRLQVRLKRPHGFMNPGGFDYEGWLFQQGIGATGYVYGKKLNVRLQQSPPLYLQRIRYSIRKKLKESLAGRENSTLIAALVIGDRSAIGDQQWQILTKTGTSHLLAISGLHIGLVAGMVFFITRRLWPLGLFTATLLPSPKAASIAGIMAALTYAGLAGFSVSTQRALVMLTVVLLAVFLARRPPFSSLITTALCAVLIIDPFAILSAAFWLSFSAIGVIAYGMSSRLKNTGLWWRWGRVQYLVALGLFPVLAFWFQQVPLLSILANLLVVPWVSFVTVPLALLGSISIFLHEGSGKLLLELCVTSIDLFWPILAYINSLNFSVLPLSQTSPLALIAAITGVLLLLLPQGIPARWVGLVWLLPLLFPVQEKIMPNKLRLTVLDVGQGLAAVIETANHTMLYDSGPRFSSRFDAGSAVILPFLRDKGLNRIDLLVQSHGDKDHIGGLPAILSNIEIEHVLSSVPERIEHKNSTACQRGQSWYWGELFFEILHPQAGTVLSGNNASCVLKISTDSGTILLTGDIEALAENQLVERDKHKLAATVLLVPHHGSLTSSTNSFLNAVEPDYAIISRGYQNRFGFPKQDIITRYEEMGAKILDTTDSGAIEVEFSKEGMKVRTYRQHAQRFWNKKN